MPSRGPDGKPLSGAALRAKKKAQLAAQQAREAKRKKAAKLAPAPGPQPAPAAMPVGLDFAALPPPPLGDPLAAMQWWNDVLLTCADKVMRDPVLNLEQRVRFLADFSAKAGMIRDKSAESKALREALKVTVKAAESTGLERAGSPPPKIPRPPS